MTALLNTRILASLAMIIFVAAAYAGATGAFFSDTETSTGNTFSAGDIDLQIDNESYVTNAAGVLVASPNNSWAISNLTNQLFFNFTDIKPGDIGEDTISIHAGSNNAWACMAAAITATPENTLVDPETDAGDAGPALGNNGELQTFLNFSFWNDDGDNVYEVGETVITALTGPASSIFNGAWRPIADSTTGTSSAIVGGSTRYVGKAWCFGGLTPAAVTQDNLGKTGTNGPLVRGTGFTCDGSGSNNIAQTDGITVDVSFQAVQTRNNAQFLCSGLPTFTGTAPQQGPTVGAALGTYVAPTGGQCNVTVDDSGGNPALDTIAEGIAAASAGQTVCVAAGTYNEDVNVNKSITLAGAGSALSLVNGQTSGEAGALVISADNVTVKGFGVTEAVGGVAAIRISGAHTGITVNSNKATGGASAFLTDGGQTNHTISNNEFVGTTANPIAYVNGLASVNVTSTNVDFTQNTFSGSGTQALGQEAGGSSVTLNKFSAVTSFTDVEDWEGGNNYNQNNFNDAGLKLQHSENGPTGDNGITNAENNWWGSAAPVGHISADVDDAPKAAVAFAQN